MGLPRHPAPAALIPPVRTTINKMAKFRARSIVLALCALCLLPLQAEDFLIGTPAIRYSLAKLNVLGSVLMIGAHPDDENNAVLAYCSRGLKLRTGYLSCTRGEGGQNLLGPEQGALLGVIRTQELLAARRDDGGEQYFTRAIDFGFTTSAEETLEKWGHDRTLADIVWVIRQQQPDVIILSFSGTPSDGHGHHQASAILGQEAYEAAGNPSRFPEQLKYVRPWRARRLLRSRFAPLEPASPGWPLPDVADRAGPDPFPNQPVITLQTGDFDPVIGRSYREISVISRNEHRSQGQGAPLVYGASANLSRSSRARCRKKVLFDGIDTSWKRVPEPAGQAICWRRRSVNSTICIRKRRSRRCSKRAPRSPAGNATGTSGRNGSWEKSMKPLRCAPGCGPKRRRMRRPSCRAGPRNFADGAEPVVSADYAGGHPPERVGGPWMRR